MLLELAGWCVVAVVLPWAILAWAIERVLAWIFGE
jgi:hypothetical protein